MGIDLSVSLNWSKKEEFYELYNFYLMAKRDKMIDEFIELYPSFNDSEYLFYIFTLDDELIYLGKTRIDTTIINRWFNQKHNKIREMMLYYPPPNAILVSGANITYINSYKRKNFLDTIQKALIWKFEPRLNVRSKNSFSTTVGSIRIRNTGDCLPIHNFSINF